MPTDAEYWSLSRFLDDYIGREAFTVTITELLESILMGGAAIGFIRKKSGNNLIKTIIN